MSIEVTLRKLDELKLKGMREALRQQLETPGLAEMSFEDRLAMLTDAEELYRLNARKDRLLRAAKLRVHAQPEDLAYGAERNLDKAMMTRLLSCDWIGRNQNVLITGKSGTGKTWLGCCLGVQAVRRGISVSYRMVSRLLEEFELARLDGTAPRLRAKYMRDALLILDDFGISKLTSAGKHDLLEILDDRIGERATIVCGQLPVGNWHGFIDNPTIADAILDRLTSAAHRIELSGPSLRRKAT